MKRKTALILFAVTFIFLTTAPLHAENPSDVGTPAFKQISSKTMTLKYGFKGASVYDNSLKKWVFQKMTTITRSKVEGYVNRINETFALAAGLYEVAIYDYSKHKWFVYNKKGGADDSTRMLKKNFELTPSYAKVKILNGPFIRYTSASGWTETQ